MTRTFSVFAAALALACGALWTRERDEPHSPPPPVPVSSAPRIEPAAAPAPVAPVVAVSEPEPEPEVVEDDCGSETPPYEATPSESSGEVAGIVTLLYRCRGSPALADDVWGEAWMSYAAAPGESVCFTDVDVFGGCAPSREYGQALERLRRMTGPSPMLRVTDVGVPPAGERVWAWSLPYELVGDAAVTLLHPEQIAVVDEVTQVNGVLPVERYESMIYGIVAAPDRETAIARVRAAASEPLDDEPLPAALTRLVVAQGPARHCPAGGAP